ncbi:MAG: hypothetical protein CHACPFDD_02403 [Phycisphaerae bacterium]|nr:hypothetical protein [Phycisphaerae bacterium]
MNICRKFVQSSMVVMLVAIVPGVARAQHEGDVIVGVSGAGQLKRSGFDVDHETIVLPPVNGILAGWSDNEPGFDHVTEPDAGNDIYPLSAGADVWMRIEAIDVAFQLVDSGFQVYKTVGDEIVLGDEALHTHLIWHINSDDPFFDAQRTKWRVTLTLFDLGSTGYADSLPFTMYFANVACTPGDVNQDGSVNGFDVDPFVAILAGASASPEERCAADVNWDGEVNGFDIEPFVGVLTGG